MREQVQKPDTSSHTLQSKSRASRQAPVADVLQAYKKSIVQREAFDEDELLQGKFEVAQREEFDEDELLQGKFEVAQREEFDEDELLQGKFEVTQREEFDDDELLQGKLEPAQRKEYPPSEGGGGLPPQLKAGVENLSGYSMNNVRVHYNSPKPAQLQALAYTQGTDIHVAPGQEKHLAHEAWHVVQQKQGRVQPTMQLQGININDNEGLEKEADEMGVKSILNEQTTTPVISKDLNSNICQMFTAIGAANITTSEGGRLAANQTLVSITSLPFALGGLSNKNHHMINAEVYNGMNCIHYRTDFNPADHDATLFGGEQGGVITNKPALPDTIRQLNGADVVAAKLINRVVTLADFALPAAMPRYKMLFPDVAQNVHNCQTWANWKYNQIN